MTEREVKLQKKLVKDQLTLFSIYWDDFEKRLGKKAMQEALNAILDKKIWLDRNYPQVQP